MKTTQRNQILEYLLAGFSLTPLEALEKFGCFRLAARIEELRDMGYAIITNRLSNGVAEYMISK